VATLDDVEWVLMGVERVGLDYSQWGISYTNIMYVILVYDITPKMYSIIE
jgi:hypothetical protein